MTVGEVALRDLDRLEEMLAGVETEEVRLRFNGLVAELYVEIYERLSPEDKLTVDKEVRAYELEQQGWELDEELRCGSWVARLFQQSLWGHWRVELYAPHGHVVDWDAQFDEKQEAWNYAHRWVSSSTRPWS